MSDWFERALRVCHDGPYSDSDLIGIYASFKQELVDRYGEEQIDDLAALIVSSLFIGARKAGDLTAYVQINKIDLEAIRQERGEDELEPFNDSFCNSHAYDNSESYLIPLGVHEVDAEMFSWRCYPERSYYARVAEMPDGSGLELWGMYIGSARDARRDGPLEYVYKPKRTHPPELESHNVTPTQHETATSAENTDETDS